MKVKITHNGKVYEFPLEKYSSWKIYKGLMFSKNKKPLLMEIKNKSIHSMFVFSPFLALWLNDDNRIVDYRLVHPFSSSIIPKSDFSKIIEIPYEGEYKNIIDEILGQKGLNIGSTLINQ